MKTSNQLLGYMGILLAIDIPLYGHVKMLPFIVINVVVLLLCILVSHLEYWFYNSQHKWVDAVFYFFSKGISEKSNVYS